MLCDFSAILVRLTGEAADWSGGGGFPIATKCGMFSSAVLGGCQCDHLGGTVGARL